MTSLNSTVYLSSINFTMSSSNIPLSLPFNAISRTENHTGSTRDDTTTSDEARIVNWAILAILGLLIIIANGMICWLFHKTARIRERNENALFCSQAIGDLLNGLVFVPVYIMEENGVISDVIPFIVCISVFLSLFSLVAIAIDRFWAIFSPFQRIRYFGKTFLAVELTVIWIIPTLLGLLPLFWWFDVPVERSSRKKIYLTFLVSLLIMAYTSMVTFLLIALFRAKKILRRRYRTRTLSGSQTEETMKRAKKTLLKEEFSALKLSFILLLCYMFGYLPTISLNILRQLGRDDLATVTLRTCICEERFQDSIYRTLSYKPSQNTTYYEGTRSTRTIKTLRILVNPLKDNRSLYKTSQTGS